MNKDEVTGKYICTHIKVGPTMSIPNINFTKMNIYYQLLKQMIYKILIHFI